jgi:outer membrane protein OmpA-like peptidoglycan-associated protein
MIRRLSFAVPALVCAMSFSSAAAAPQAKEADATGCADHPLLSRMQHMIIVSCRSVEFDRVAFKTGKGTDTPVEGRRFEVRYRVASGTPPPSAVAIIRNHQQAIAKVGGASQYEDQRYATLKVVRDGKEVWVQVDTAWGGGYLLTFIEKRAMAQEVIASAALFSAGLSHSGHVEVPGIFFDSGKSELKPESEAAIAEVARLLTSDPALRVFVVGHTDNVASFELNTRLSQARAESVVQALISTHGIAAARLAARGVGPLAPVASNDSDEGRARNRRVELVKQ